MAANADGKNDCTKILNFNIGVLGHVDSGKTTLSKTLSTTASTAAFDKNPQSKERGITLDLGFSSFLINLPSNLTDKVAEIGYKSDEIQITLVDCPGHASLIKTIIGGAQIIDLMMLVVDITKGMQTQTAECLVIGEILCEKMIVVLNKIDLVEEKKRESVIEKMKKKMLKTLESTRFARCVPIVAVSANQGDADSVGNSIGITELVDCLKNQIYVPKRDAVGPFMFSVDHCFSIRGQGTVMTGTVLSGGVAVNDVVELPALKETKKVKSMQMFHKPIKRIMQGDRAGICVTQFDPRRMERGVVCSPNYLNALFGAVVRVHKIPYFKGTCANKAKFHITVGHETVMAKLQFFGLPQNSDSSQYACGLSNDLEYTFQDCLLDETKSSNAGGPVLQYVILQFDRPVTCMSDSLLIGSKLDSDINLNACRLAFHGRIVSPFLTKDYEKTYLPTLKIYKTKQKEGVVERISDDYSVIVRSLFKKETNLQLFQNMKVVLSTGETGILEGSFGQSGKVKVRIQNGLNDSTKELLTISKKGKGKKLDEGNHVQKEQVKVFMDFKKYIYDKSHKMIQT